MGRFQRGGLLALLQLLMVATAQVPDISSQQSYVVYLGGHPVAGGIPSTVHHDKLTSLLGSSDAASSSLIYSYNNFNAFAAKLSPEQAAALSGEEGVSSVFPNKANNLLTTHSWAFLGLEDSFGNVPSDSLWTKSNYGKDMIIGLLDSGVWPESASFDDSGLGPIPARWKGRCVAGDQFGPSYCNKLQLKDLGLLFNGRGAERAMNFETSRKLIGGRYYIKGHEAAEGPLNITATGEYLSARDAHGHGTHTSTTAGGSFSVHANSLGFAPGTAKGGAPLSRIAMYKVCWSISSNSGGCFAYDADILRAFDQGISDGVDVFSVSLGGGLPLSDFFEDSIAVGSFHASQNNISVVASAGNGGPDPGTVLNVAPWITTVAASSIDRDFLSYATLGNNDSLRGESFSERTLMDKFYPLVSSAMAAKDTSNTTNSTQCLPGSLDPARISGKIVACVTGVTSDLSKGQVVKAAGGVGLILINSILMGATLKPRFHVLPATQITYTDGIQVFSYINTTKSPVAKLSPARTVLGVKPAPVVTDFSSQGPNTLVPDLLKPDITGPGLNILAAFTRARPMTSLIGDTRIVKYNILYGTSMSCPHVAGTIASLKAYHPTWTPAAIHSAIVTTANLYDNKYEGILNNTLNPASPFAFGGGHLAPNSAAEPGLVYDNHPNDYIKFLCSLGYSKFNISIIVGQNYTCPRSPPTVSNFNYPTLTVSDLVQDMIVNRTVTNVGTACSTYNVTIVSPPGIETRLSPSVLKFSALGQKITFSVKLTKMKTTNGQYSFGSYTWTDGTHSVRSPLVVRTFE